VPSGRLVVLLGAACVVIALLGVALLNGWLDPGRANRADLRGEIEERLFDQIDRLGALQGQSDDDREVIYRAIDGLTAILNDGRNQATVSRAVTQYEEVEARVTDARKAAVDLPKVTEEILSLARTGEANSRFLQELERHRGRLRRWELLEGAMREMTGAHRIYSTLNTRLIDGFRTYDQLYERTREWVTKERAGDFKTPTIAAEYYSHASEPLLFEMRRLAEDLQELEAEVADAATRAKAAFDLVEKEVEAGSR
jgi:hypothetical protein